MTKKSFEIVRVYKGAGKNGADHEYKFNVTSARYANEEKTAAVMSTVEHGDMLTSLTDQPHVWAQLVGSGIEIEPMPETPYNERRIGEKHPPIGDQLDAMFKHRQKQKLLVGKARAAAKDGDLVAALAHALEALEPTDELDVLDARLREIKEKHPKPADVPSEASKKRKK